MGRAHAAGATRVGCDLGECRGGLARPLGESQAFEILTIERCQHGYREDTDLLIGGVGSCRKHRGSPGGVDGKPTHPPVAEQGAHRTPNGVGDIVQLEIEKDRSVRRHDLEDGRAVGQESLEPKLEGADPRAQQRGEATDFLEVGQVQRDRKSRFSGHRSSGQRVSVEEHAARILPGLLGGAHVVLLFAFLNPHLPLLGSVLGPLGSASVVGGAALSWTVSTIAGWLLASPTRRALPWLLSAEILLAAVWYGTHASILSFALHPSVDRRLIKAAVGLALLGLVAFYTALVHSLAGRPYGRGSRLLLALLGFASLWVSVERREAIRLPQVPLAPANAIARMPTQLLLVTLNGADLELLLPLAESGDLPFFARAFRDGTYGPVTALEPAEWFVQEAAVGTGKMPYRSGLVGASRWRRGAAEILLAPRPLGGAFLLRMGFTTMPTPPPSVTFVDIPALLAPAETFRYTRGESAHLSQALAGLRDLEEALLAGHDPAVHRLTILALAQTQVLLSERGRRAEASVGNDQAHVVALLQGVDTVLGRLWAAQPDGTVNLVVVSAAGPDRRRRWLPGALPVRDGVFLGLGPAFEPDRFVGSIDAVEVAPTVLHLAGFPSARDFDGRVRVDVLAASWRNRYPVGVLPSYDFLARRKR